MSSGQQEPNSFQQVTELSENMTFKQLIGYLVSLAERVSVMEETSDLYSENMSEMI